MQNDSVGDVRCTLWPSEVKCDFCVILVFDTHPDSEVTFALSYSLLVSLPLMRSAGLWHVGGLLPPQALPKLVHLGGHVLPGTVNGEKGRRFSCVEKPERPQVSSAMCTRQFRNAEKMTVASQSTDAQKKETIQTAFIYSQFNSWLIQS